MVTELMICKGEVVADFSSTNGVPVPYRGQRVRKHGRRKSQPLKSQLLKSRLCVQSFRHESMGLEAYLQVTSPIRRTVDVISHLQIKAHLRGERLVFERDALENEISRNQGVTENLKLLIRKVSVARTP